MAHLRAVEFLYVIVGLEVLVAVPCLIFYTGETPPSAPVRLVAEIVGLCQPSAHVCLTLWTPSLFCTFEIYKH